MSSMLPLKMGLTLKIFSLKSLVTKNTSVNLKGSKVKLSGSMNLKNGMKLWGTCK